MSTRNSFARTGVAAFALAATVTLAACSSGTSDPAASESSAPAASEGVDLAGSTVTMTVPVTESGDSPYVLISDAYMAEFPDRTIELQELPGDSYAQSVRTQLQAGNASDIIYVTPGGGNPQALQPFAASGFLAPLDGTGAEDTIPDSSRSLFEVDGVLYGQGLDLTVVSAVVNAGVMAEDGVEMPATYDEMLGLCGDIAADGKSLFVVAGTAVPNTGLTSMAVAASRVYAPEPDWNDKRAAGEVTFAESEGWLDTLNALIEMNDSGCFQEGVEGGDFGTITVGLGQGTSYAAFIPSGAAFQLATETGGTFTVDAMPGLTEDTTLIYASINNALALTADAENAEAAQAFLDWLAQSENLVTYANDSGNLPLGPITADDLPEAYQPVAQYIVDQNYAVLPNQAWTNGEVYNALGMGVQGLFTGQTTPEDVLAAMDAAWDK
ncbi:extracellular solute-binding protein [Demequina sp. SYSU T00039]|uniref:Extracellular solute-binding protein n=1 Tax=Demequina lignilytica TaxID=3051663 RepID=A0AAW7M339_9MICO|nr:MULTISPECIES: extracellular solute-binding protein [unclassified Demequina]MDN4477918.1 extracellular solute-binding protein [Demequina sp. SYSU T00039-1]MDN4487827.1 extracellular solute-binding protein [Demequina sp. SYSU T00039]MDN4490790.1 extracellular solute-binding protein [Demequina sp. SYSU T00068]